MTSRKYAKQAVVDSGIAFGTSGARGLVEQFTDEVCAAFTASFLSLMRERFSSTHLAIAMDRRPSSPRMVAACTTAAKALGYEVEDYGVLPTPALAYQAMSDGVPAIMVTGSHIPFDRNGLKFYRPDGEIGKADEQAILQSEAVVPEFVDVSRQVLSERAREAYLARYLNIFPDMPLKGKRIGIYEHSSAGRDLYGELLERLGATVVSLARSDDFVPIDTEAVSEADRQRGRDWAREHRLDALFSTDGDGDRPLLADENGQWLRGDIVGLLCARELGIKALAVPVSCNTAIETSAAFETVMRTRIGSPYVIEAMESLAGDYSSVAGFEANGGFLLGSEVALGNASLTPLPTRDAVLPVLAVLHAAVVRGQPLSALVNELPERYTASDRLKQVATERSHALLAKWQHNPETMMYDLALEHAIHHLDTTDGLRVNLANGDIVHLRPSGNAPELRCYVESGTMARAEALVAHCLGKIESLEY